VHLLAAADVERLPRDVGGEVAGEIGAGVAEVLALAAGAGIVSLGKRIFRVA